MDFCEMVHLQNFFIIINVSLFLLPSFLFPSIGSTHHLLKYVCNVVAQMK